MSMKRLIATALLAGAVLSSGRGQSELENVLSPGRLPFLKKGLLKQVSSADTSGGNSDFIAIPAGASARIADLAGPGVITQIWVTVAARDPYFLRRLLLRAYWDGEKDPSIEVPIGDFFGTGFVYKQYVTPFLGMSSGGYYACFPMPFNRSARLEVVNESDEEVQSFYFHIDYHQLSGPLDPTVAYFHANWRREPRTPPGRDYLLLDALGEGHLVGITMSMQSYDGDTQFLEGDEEFTVDGEQHPSIVGTGTEDYFNSGWYFNRGEFAAPYHGLILKDDSLSRVAAYRFHILDAVPFRKSLHAVIEHGDRNKEIADYSSTAYWYQKEPHAPFAPMLRPGMRIPLRVRVPNGALEAEGLTPSSTSLAHAVSDMSPFGADWSGFRQLLVEGRKAGDRFTLSLPVEEEEYDVDVYYTKGPAYADVDISSSGKSLGSLHGFSSATEPGGKVAMEGVHAVNGVLPLDFTLAGRNPRSTAYAVGLDAFVMHPRRTFIPAWSLIGPFGNPRDASLRRLGIDIAYPPEREFVPGAAYPGVDGQQVAWRTITTPAKGRVDLYMFDPYEMVVVYAHTFVHSPIDQTLPLLIGSDDGSKVFLNGKEIYRYLDIRVAQPDQDRVELRLRKGWNSLLIKIENNYGGYNFFARILDPGRTLRYSLTEGE
jgi:hypothetical protein